jgi:hypothetical protein
MGRDLFEIVGHLSEVPERLFGFGEYLHESTKSLPVFLSFYLAQDPTILMAESRLLITGTGNSLSGELNPSFSRPVLTRMSALRRLLARLLLGTWWREVEAHFSQVPRTGSDTERT